LFKYTLNFSFGFINVNIIFLFKLITFLCVRYSQKLNGIQKKKYCKKEKTLKVKNKKFMRIFTATLLPIDQKLEILCDAKIIFNLRLTKKKN
jgi:hypothetical protein